MSAEQKARVTAAVALVAGLSLTTAVPAEAAGLGTASPSWRLSNSAGSYTGAIFHRAAADRIYGNAVTIQPGGDQRKISMTVDMNQDWPYGIKVWHPGTCTKVYERIGFIWFRVEKYKGSARDVWVTKSIGSAGEKFRVKILKDC